MAEKEIIMGKKKNISIGQSVAIGAGLGLITSDGISKIIKKILK